MCQTQTRSLLHFLFGYRVTENSHSTTYLLTFTSKFFISNFTNYYHYRGITLFSSLKMSSYDTSLFDYDAGYYEFLPNNWLPGRIVPGGRFTWSQKAIDAAVNLDLKDSDVIVATYPKTGWSEFTSYFHKPIVAVPWGVLHKCWNRLFAPYS